MDTNQNQSDGEQNTSIEIMKSSNSSQNYNEISALIEGVLLQTQERFQTMSNQILRRIDDMGKRVDELEKNISELMAEAGVSLPSTTIANE